MGEISAYSLSRLSASSLSTLKTNAEAALNSILTTGQSYTIGGRSFTRADLGELTDLLAKLVEAQSLQSGTRIKATYTDFR